MAQVYSPAPSIDRPQQTAGATIQVLLPAYNEEAALPQMLEDLERILGGFRFAYHVTVVDDGSADSTADIVREASERLPVTLVSHPRNLGLAAAMRTGLSTLAEEADADDVIVAMDSDNTHPIGSGAEDDLHDPRGA